MASYRVKIWTGDQEVGYLMFDPSKKDTVEKIGWFKRWLINILNIGG